VCFFGSCPEDAEAPDVTLADVAPKLEVVVGTLAGEPRGIAVVQDDVFVLDDDQMIRFSATDAGWTSKTVASGLGTSRGLVAAGDALYFSGAINGKSGVFRMRTKSLGTIETVALAMLPPPEGIAADDSGVRWLEHMIGLVESDGDGGSTVTVSAPVDYTPVFSPVSRAATTTHFVAQGFVLSRDDDGGVTSVMVPNAVAVAAGASGVFGARAIDGGFELGALTDAGFAMLGSAGCRALAAGANALYVADDIGHQLQKITNVAMVVLAKTNGEPHDLVLANGYVFFTIRPTGNAVGEVRRVPE